MLVIRLFRTGRTNQPSYKIVVADKRRPTHAGRFVEELGSWNPITKEKVLKSERIKYWLSVGAKPSVTIYNMLISDKIIEGKKIPQQKKSKTETRDSGAKVKMRTEFSSPGEKKEEDKPRESPPAGGATPSATPVVAQAAPATPAIEKPIEPAPAPAVEEK